MKIKLRVRDRIEYTDKTSYRWRSKKTYKIRPPSPPHIKTIKSECTSKMWHKQKYNVQQPAAILEQHTKSMRWMQTKDTTFEFLWENVIYLSQCASLNGAALLREMKWIRLIARHKRMLHIILSNANPVGLQKSFPLFLDFIQSAVAE